MNDLGPKELELLSALRASDEPVLADRERIRRRVWLAVGLAAVGSSGVGIGTQTAVAATPKLGLLATTTAKVGLVVGLATGGAVLATQPWSMNRSVDESKHALVHSVESAGSQSVLQVVKSEQTSLDVPEVEPKVVSPGEAKNEAEAPAGYARSRVKVPSSPEALSSADLDAEIELLQSARQALQAGQFPQAMQSLSEHARRFPKGVLASERQASMAIALCRSGEIAKGKARGAHYLKHNAKSPLAERVRTSCKLEP